MYFGRKKTLTRLHSFWFLLIDGVVLCICLLTISLWCLMQTLISKPIQQKLKVVQQVWIWVYWIDAEVWWTLWWLYDSLWWIYWDQDIYSTAWEVFVPSLLDLAQNYFPSSLLWNIANKHKDVIMDLVWESWPQSYLILLQNTNESRPNWWFFGSYIHVTFSWWILTNVDFRDSYLPWFDRPWVWIEWPEWLLEMMPTNEIHFVWANKIWFTYADWWHIQKLYQLAYPNEILRWIIFVRLDMILELFPELYDTVVKWQFINAMADKLPKESWEKKSVYLQNIQEVSKALLPRLLQYSLQGLDYSQIIDIYLEEIPWDFHSFLKENDLTTRFDENVLYWWDSNISFSKTDGFVDRNIECIPIACKSNYCEPKNWKERIDIGEFQSWDTLSCTKSYEFIVPNSYIELISSFENEFWVVLWSREEHILWINRTWWTRWIVYIWNQRSLSWLGWDIYDESVFPTPFGQWITYKIWMDQEWKTMVNRVMQKN